MLDGVAALLTTLLTLLLYVLRSRAERKAAAEPEQEAETIDAAIQSHDAGREAAVLQRVANELQRHQADAASAARQQHPDPDRL